METWEEEMLKRIEESRRVREGVQSKFGGYGYPEQELSTLAYDLSEFYGACLNFVSKCSKVLDDRDQDPDLVSVELAKLEAILDEAQHHLNDLSRSLRGFHSFVSDLGEDTDAAQSPERA